MADSLARSLGGEGVPVEPPRPARSHHGEGARWLALAVFALLGASGILLIP